LQDALPFLYRYEVGADVCASVPNRKFIKKLSFENELVSGEGALIWLEIICLAWMLGEP